MKAHPPKADEIEVSLFGPGYGECILVHLGRGQWMIVDSCRDQRSGNQPAVAYLERLGIDPGEAVRVVVATHWHRDHVRGLADVVGRCVGAEFWTSAALSSSEALVLTGQIGATQLTRQSPLREFFEVIERLKVRATGGGPGFVKTASVGGTIYRRTRDSTIEATVTALSPHALAVEAARRSFKAATESRPPGNFAGPAVHPNHAALVLGVRVGDHGALLGSDLETTAPGGGWASIANAGFDGTPASVYKVPHHGSRTAHEEAVWEKLLVNGAVAAITPFRPSRLPKADMAREILAKSPRTYLTAPPRTPSQRSNPRRIRALQRGSAIRVEDLEGRSGHVRVRFEQGSPAEVVDLRLPALRLQSVL